MLRKSILIGLFVLKNNGTITEPESLQGGQEGQLSPHAFFRVVMGGTGKWGVFRTGGYGRHRCQWVKPYLAENFPFKALIAVFWDFQPLWPSSLTKPDLLRFRCSSGHFLSKTKSATPHFFYISDITNSSSFNGKIFREKSMLENFRANILNVKECKTIMSTVLEKGCFQTTLRIASNNDKLACMYFHKLTSQIYSTKLVNQQLLQTKLSLLYT